MLESFLERFTKTPTTGTGELTSDLITPTDLRISSLCFSSTVGLPAQSSCPWITIPFE